MLFDAVARSQMLPGAVNVRKRWIGEPKASNRDGFSVASKRPVVTVTPSNSTMYLPAGPLKRIHNCRLSLAASLKSVSRPLW